MTRSHWFALGLALTALSVRVSSYSSFHEMVTPKFLAECSLAIGSLITALASPSIVNGNGIDKGIVKLDLNQLAKDAQNKTP